MSCSKICYKILKIVIFTCEGYNMYCQFCGTKNTDGHQYCKKMRKTAAYIRGTCSSRFFLISRTTDHFSGSGLPKQRGCLPELPCRSRILLSYCQNRHKKFWRLQLLERVLRHDSAGACRSFMRRLWTDKDKSRKLDLVGV